MLRRMVASIALPALCAGAVSGCSGTHEPPKSAAPSSAQAPAEGSAGSAAPSRSGKPTSHARRAVQRASEIITVTVKGGKSFVSAVDTEVGKISDDPDTVRVKQDEHVVLTVNSDVADEVHVHGYDLKKEAEPGQPVTLAFDATVPGRFLAELEDRHLTILRFTVR